MKRAFPLFLRAAAVWLLGCLCSLQAQTLSFGGRPEVVQVSTYWSDSGVIPGSPITLAVVLDIRPPYHINANTAQDPFIPTEVSLLNAPPELRSSTPIFPKAEEITFGPDKEKNSVFTKRAVVYIPMSLTGSMKTGPAPFQVQVAYQACDDKTCLRPTKTTAEVRLPVVANRGEIHPINAEIFAGLPSVKETLSVPFFGWDFKIEPSKLWLLLAVAMVGGLLLNFTPCVLPLIPIKIIGLSKAAGNRQRCFLLGLSLSAGVIAFWLALAGAISSVRGFDATNKLFQYPAFTITVGVIIAVMAVGMCGLFAVTLPQWVYHVNPSQESVVGSFFFGIMTAVLSTPCTAPFMGAAAAWSATQRPTITLTTFAVIGLGMSLPYLLLSAFPVLVHRMPRTGPASELIKQVMGLLMLGAGAYFLGTGLAGLLAKPPDPPSDAYWYLVAFCVAAAGGWLVWRTIQITPKFGSRFVFGALGLVLVFGGVGVGTRFTRHSPIRWVYYTPDRLAQAQKDKKVVVLEFTAAWCLNCHALEQAVLNNREIVHQLNATGVAPIKVDITGNNPLGNEKLVEVGRRTIPYLVVYSPAGKEVFASDAYTVEQLNQALEQARRML